MCYDTYGREAFPNMFFFYDWTFLIVLPGLILALIAQAGVSGTFAKYQRVPARIGLTGAMLPAACWTAAAFRT